LGLVPRQADILFTNYEKNKLFGSQKQLGSIQKLTRKSVATQTLDLSRVIIKYILVSLFLKSANFEIRIRTGFDIWR
jgi:hypothetical protein